MEMFKNKLYVMLYRELQKTYFVRGILVSLKKGFKFKNFIRTQKIIKPL